LNAPIKTAQRQRAKSPARIRCAATNDTIKSSCQYGIKYLCLALSVVEVIVTIGFVNLKETDHTTASTALSEILPLFEGSAVIMSFQLRPWRQPLSIVGRAACEPRTVALQRRLNVGRWLLAHLEKANLLHW